MSSIFSSSSSTGGGGATSSSPSPSSASSSPTTTTAASNQINARGFIINGNSSLNANHVNKLANRLNNLLIGGANTGIITSGGNRSSPTPSSPTQPSSSPGIILSKTSTSTQKSTSTPRTNGSSGSTNSQTNGGKLLTVSLSANDNPNGVACSLVKSNTNIYYNLKVDSIGSKAIHYCDQCTNPDCRAIHKSLTKPLVQPQQSSGPRIYLQQNSNSASTPSTPSSPSPNSTPNAKGANINFIFERRYPLVQLNGNLLGSLTGDRPQSPNSGQQQQPQRILIRPTHHSGDDNSQFPLPLSPSSLHHAVAAAAALAHAQSNADPTKPATFSFNFNRLTGALSPVSSASPLNITPTHFRAQSAQATSPTSTSTSTSQPQQTRSLNSPTLNSAGLKNLTAADLEESLSLFPTVNLNNLRYKNIMFLDQFNNKDQRPQSPTSPTTVQQQQQQHGPLSVRDLANEKYSGTAANNNNLKTSTTGSSAALSTSPYNTSTTTTAANKQPQPQTAQNKAAQSSQQTSTTTTTSPTSKSGDNMVQQRILAANNTNNTATSAAELIGAVNKLKPTYTSTIENNTKSQAEIQSTQKQLKTADLTTSPTSTTTATTTTTTPTKAEVVKTPGKQQQQQQHKHPHPYQPHHHHHQQIHVPQFYFPQGRHDDKHFRSIDDVENMKLVCNEFKAKKDGKWHREDFADLLKMLGLPCYWKTLLFRACTHNSKLNYVTYSVLEQTWSKLTSNCYDRVSLFMKLITTGFSAVYEDWEPLLQDIVDTHPGLKFLHDHKEFHTRYIKTVIARIYYTVNRSWSGKITATELRKSNFLDVLESLEYEDDINLIKDYFSYEHFYVIYCKFWELDKDHDLYISREDLYRHNNYAISARVIDRIFSGTVLRGRDWREGLMSYYDFVWFLISEEDKRSSTSVEYWFRVLDMDGDGVLSMYELEYFYNEQIEQMRERQIEYMPFNDLLCQMLDLVKPAEPGKIRLKDLKQCKMANVFFDTFINLEKYLEYEQRDPFSNYRDTENPEQSDWDKYAAEEYENLVSEDVNGDNGDMYNNYEDDFEDDALLFNNNNQSANNSNGNGNGNNNSNSPIPQQQND